MFRAAQFFQAVMQPGLDGAERATEQRGDLVQRRAGKEPQFENRAVFVGQRRHRRLHQPRLLRLLGGRRRFGLAGRPVDGGLLPTDCRSWLAPGLEKPMPQNAVQPSREPAPAVEPPQRPPGLEERFLGQVLSVVIVAAQGPRAPPQRLGV